VQQLWQQRQRASSSFARINLDPPQFHEYFAADLSAEQAAFMARSQVL
jgi:uncharacterized protein (DUF736 family)